MSSPAPRAARAGCACVAAWLLTACSPALDWREVRPASTAAILLMPCKPVTQERSLALAGAPVRLSLLACTAEGQTWGLAHADVADPARVGAALEELRRAAAANISSGTATPLPLQVPGATPQAASLRVRLGGRLPDGRPVQMQVALFALGTRVFQATALGERLEPEASEIFFGSIRLQP